MFLFLVRAHTDTHTNRWKQMQNGQICMTNSSTVSICLLFQSQKMKNIWEEQICPYIMVNECNLKENAWLTCTWDPTSKLNIKPLTLASECLKRKAIKKQTKNWCLNVPLPYCFWNIFGILTCLVEVGLSKKEPLKKRNSAASTNTYHKNHFYILFTLM